MNLLPFRRARLTRPRRFRRTGLEGLSVHLLRDIGLEPGRAN